MLAQLLVFFWLGGAVCMLTSVMIIVASKPEKLEELGITLVHLMMIVLLWPWTIWKAHEYVNLQSRWDSKLKPVKLKPMKPKPVKPPQPIELPGYCDDCSRRTREHIKAFDSPVPGPCASCDAQLREYERAFQDHCQKTPEPCDDCKRKFADWRRDSGLDDEEPGR